MIIDKAFQSNKSKGNQVSGLGRNGQAPLLNACLKEAWREDWFRLDVAINSATLKMALIEIYWDCVYRPLSQHSNEHAIYINSENPLNLYCGLHGVTSGFSGLSIASWLLQTYFSPPAPHLKSTVSTCFNLFQISTSWNRCFNLAVQEDSTLLAVLCQKLAKPSTCLLQMIVFVCLGHVSRQSSSSTHTPTGLRLRSGSFIVHLLHQAQWHVQELLFSHPKGGWVGAQLQKQETITARNRKLIWKMIQTVCHTGYIAYMTRTPNPNALFVVQTSLNSFWVGSFL